MRMAPKDASRFESLVSGYQGIVFIIAAFAAGGWTFWTFVWGEHKTDHMNVEVRVIAEPVDEGSLENAIGNGGAFRQAGFKPGNPASPSQAITNYSHHYYKLAVTLSNKGEAKTTLSYPEKPITLTRMKFLDSGAAVPDTFVTLPCKEPMGRISELLRPGATSHWTCFFQVHHPGAYSLEYAIGLPRDGVNKQIGNGKYPDDIPKAVDTISFYVPPDASPVAADADGSR